MVMEVKLNCFCGCHCAVAVPTKIFLPFLNEIGNSKLFELYLFFHHGSTMATETEQSTFVTMVVQWYYLPMIWRTST